MTKNIVNEALENRRPSRQNGIHDGFDRRKQAVKMADVFGIEKVWAAIYEGSRQHGVCWFQKKELNI